MVRAGRRRDPRRKYSAAEVVYMLYLSLASLSYNEVQYFVNDSYTSR